jgi:hypothetical protein
MPAKAGIQFTRYRIFWIPAFAGMTVCIAENSPSAAGTYTPSLKIIALLWENSFKEKSLSFKFIAI